MVTNASGSNTTSAADLLIVDMMINAPIAYVMLASPSSHESDHNTPSRASWWKREMASLGLDGKVAARGPPLTVCANNILVRIRVKPATHHRTTTQIEPAKTIQRTTSITPIEIRSPLMDWSVANASNASLSNQPVNNGIKK